MKLLALKQLFNDILPVFSSCDRELQVMEQNNNRTPPPTRHTCRLQLQRERVRLLSYVVFV